MEKRVNKAKLADAIATAFSKDEMHALCMHVGVDFDDLPGDTRSRKAGELVEKCERAGLLDTLVVYCFNERPNLYWDRAVLDVPNSVIMSMMPRLNGKTTTRLQGMQMARLEGRLNQVEIGQARIKALVATSLTANGFLVLMSVLDKVTG